MKQYSLEHPMFDGYLNGSCIHRRSALRQLMETHEAFPYCPSNIRIKKIRTFLLFTLITSLLVLSTFTIATLVEGIRMRKVVMNEIYTVKNRQAEEKKMNLPTNGIGESVAMNRRVK